jgi:polyhydroxybutyrate depolymerase
VHFTLLQVGGELRSYIVHAPAGAETGLPLPVLVVFHGAGSDAAKAEVATGFSPAADDDGFIVVYPNGTRANSVAGELSWNAGDCCGLAKRDGVDDAGFVDAMLADVAATYPVDPDRIYLAGFSNGGMLSYRLACTFGSRFAGIAVVSGALNYQPCDPSGAVSVLIVHGTADATVPYEGGKSNNRTAARFGQWTNTSVDFATDFWRQHDQCDEDAVVTTEEGVTTEDYPDCADRTRLTRITIEGGGHSWPRLATMGIDASARILDFFALDAPAG